MNEIVCHQKEFVGMLNDQNLMPGFTVRLAKNFSAGNPRPSKWIPWDEWDWNTRVDFYTILPNEVVFDIDAPVFFTCEHCQLLFEANKYLQSMPNYVACPHCHRYTSGTVDTLTYSPEIIKAQQLEDKMKDMKVPFYRYASGGKGIHYEVYLSTDDAREKNIDWMAMRSQFAEKVSSDINYCMDIRNDNWFMDKRKWQWNEQTTMGSMLRIVGGRKIGTKSQINSLPTKPIFRDDPLFPKEINTFKVQPLIRDPKANRRARQYAATNILPIKSLDICVLSMIDQIKSGQHLSHLQNLAVGARCLAAGISDEEIHQIYSNDPKYSQMKTNEQLFSVRQMLLTHPERIVSCKTIQERGWCPSPEICKDLSRRKQ